jgi:hypothetical protein
MSNLDFATFAQAIARNLESWTWEEPKNKSVKDSWQFLAGPKGAKLNLHYDKYGGRIGIHGEYPRSGGTIYPWNDRDRPEAITVSARREPFAIAKDIERRYLPAYLAAYRRGLEMFQRAKADEQGRKDLAARLAQLCGECLCASSCEFSTDKADSFRLHVRVDDPDRAAVTIKGLSAQQAEAVLKFLLVQVTPAA